MPVPYQEPSVSTLAHNSTIRGSVAAKGRALIIEPEPLARANTSRLASDFGYQPQTAATWQIGAELARSSRPDIVLMDVDSTPESYESVATMKRICGDDFVPVLLMSASQNPELLVRCIEAGGDYVLTKPYHPQVLLAKLTAIDRFRDLHRELRSLYRQQQRDEILAEQVFNQAVIARNSHLPTLKSYLQGLSRFSGDVLLSEHSPGGGLHLLLGDFTGHGLAAALGALPAGEVFRTMSKKGFTPEQILAGINDKLCDLLPTGMFMAVQFVQIEPSLNWIRVINNGMPDVLLIDRDGGGIRGQVASGGLPLGITTDLEFGPSSRKYAIKPGDRILMYSDGVIEARNPDGEIFGAERLLAACTKVAPGAPLLDDLVTTLKRFRGQAEQNDDISLVEIPCLPGILRPAPTESPKPTAPDPTLSAGADLRADFEFSVTQRGPSLRNPDLVPRIFGQLRDLFPTEAHRQAIFTILTELYVNAIDHGVLQLPSAIKSSADGFAKYYIERERRLANLEQGWIRFDVHVRQTRGGGQISIRIEDSGAGFDLERIAEQASPALALCGRGLELIRELAGNLSIEPPGNRASICYRW